MTSVQRAYLKGLASKLDPSFRIGKSGLTPELTEAIREFFNRNELVKVVVLKNCLEDPREIAQTAADRTRSQLVHKPDPEKPKIQLPKSGGQPSSGKNSSL